MTEEDTNCTIDNCTMGHKAVHCHDCKEIHKFHPDWGMLYTCRGLGNTTARKTHCHETLHRLNDGTYADQEQEYRFEALW